MSRGSAKRALSSTGGYCNAQEERERKRLALLHELVPRASRFAALISDSANTQFNASELKAAASAAGLKIEIFKANTIERSISPLLISFERKPMHSWLWTLSLVQAAMGKSSDASICPMWVTNFITSGGTRAVPPCALTPRIPTWNADI